MFLRIGWTNSKCSQFACYLDLILMMKTAVMKSKTLYFPIFCDTFWRINAILQNFESIFRSINRYRTEKKSSPQDCVPLWGHFAPRLFLLRVSFFDRNLSEKIRMALKRHTVLYRLNNKHF